MVRLRSVIDDTLDSDEEHNHHLRDHEGLEKVVMAAAKVWSNVLLDENGLCSVYCNQQVQYENASSSFVDEDGADDDASQSGRRSAQHHHKRYHSMDQFHFVTDDDGDDEERYETDKDYRLLSFSENSVGTRSSVRSLFQRLDNGNSSSNIFNGIDGGAVGNTSLAEEQIQRYRDTLFDEETLVDTLHNRIH